MDGLSHNDALVKVVRLTIETNILTSKSTLDSFCEPEGTIFTLGFLASVGIVSLLLIAIFPVSDTYIYAQYP